VKYEYISNVLIQRRVVCLQIKKHAHRAKKRVHHVKKRAHRAKNRIFAQQQVSLFVSVQIKKHAL